MARFTREGFTLFGGAWVALLAALASCGGGGQPSDFVSTRIFGGDDVEAEEFPAQVFILSLAWVYERNTYELLFCGGTIISSSWILTAAHCVTNAQHTIVKAGSHDRTIGDELDVKQTITHDAFYFDDRSKKRVNDIALLELSEPLPLNGISTAAASLPSRGHPAPAGQGIAVGWGRHTYEEIQEFLPGILQKLDVDIIACPDATRNALCVQSLWSQGGICYGDLGGPLLVNDMVFGVASYVAHKNKSLPAEDHCDGEDTWGVYTPVINHRLWIKKHTGI